MISVPSYFGEVNVHEPRQTPDLLKILLLHLRCATEEGMCLKQQSQLLMKPEPRAERRRFSRDHSECGKAVSYVGVTCWLFLASSFGVNSTSSVPASIMGECPGAM